MQLKRRDEKQLIKSLGTKKISKSSIRRRKRKVKASLTAKMDDILEALPEYAPPTGKDKKSLRQRDKFVKSQIMESSKLVSNSLHLTNPFDAIRAAIKSNR